MKIYTKSGDDGYTGLLRGGRILKSSLRVEAYGTVDELNSSLGVVRSFNQDKEIDPILEGIQNDLHILGAQLASAVSKEKAPSISSQRVNQIENIIDKCEGELDPLSNFILPGGSSAAAFLHISRGICRRAERRAVALSKDEDVDANTIIYLNRLSDLLFVLSRLANKRAGVSDTEWRYSE